MRIRKISLLAAALAVSAGACGDVGFDELGSINGEGIELAEVAALRSSYEPGEINTNTEQFRADLSNVLFREAIVQAARDDLGITITEADVDQRLEDPPPHYAPIFDDVRANPDLTEAALRHQATISLLRDQVTVELVRADADLESILDATPEAFTSACILHILVATAEEADAVVDRLEAGEEFGAVADEVSLDTGSPGGELRTPDGSCMIPLATFVPEFANAAATGPLGELIGPVQTQFGFHVIVVDERAGPPTVDEVRADPLGVLDNATVSDYFTPWFNAVIGGADIELDPLLGTWSEAGFGIIAPGA